MRRIILTVVLLLALAVFITSEVQADPAGPVQSVNVAIIGSPGVINGGSLPTNGGPDLAGITFTNLAPGNVNAASLAAFDTVVLNVASTEMNCTTANLTTAAKADLVAFVAGGGKLIIYDSECATVDYSWLPFPFTTVNPGALGAQGTLTIVEENTLSTSAPADPYYIDAAALGSATDAVGDMNVMITYDPNWCLDMSGTNAVPAQGPVHTYAKYPAGTDTGLFIYNGLDVDYMGFEPSPPAPNGLRKIWVQELQQPFNPSNLPCGVTAVGITLDPPAAENPAGADHTVTATVTDLLGDPQPGVLVTFIVVSGPNAGAAGTCSPNADCTTDANGQVSFTYTGTGGVGTDEIQACFINQAQQEVCSQIVTKEWTVAPVPVGGVMVPVSKVEILAPWAGLAALAGLILAGAVVLMRKRVG